MMSQFTEACMRSPVLVLYSHVILFELYIFILDILLFLMSKPMFHPIKTDEAVPKKSYIMHDSIVSVNYIPRKQQLYELLPWLYTMLVSTGRDNCF